MRASVTLDDDLLKRAHEYTGLTERAELLHEALKSIFAREAGRRLLALAGTAPKIKDVRRRRVDEPCPRRHFDRVEMFRRGRFKAELATLIGNDQLCTHPFVVSDWRAGISRPAANTPRARQAHRTTNRPPGGRAIHARNSRLVFQRHRLHRCSTHCLVHYLSWHADLDHRQASRQSRGIPRPSRNSVTFLTIRSLPLKRT